MKAITSVNRRSVLQLAPTPLKHIWHTMPFVTCLAVVSILSPGIATAGGSAWWKNVDVSYVGHHAKPKPRAPRFCANGVLPPQARPFGYSLDDMASAVANFSITGNDPAYYPDTPFQIIYNKPDHTFTVRPGTFLYVKFFYIDDAEPVLGNWPANQWEAVHYMFGRDQLGGHDLEIEVDGKVASLAHPGYIGGPVLTPDSPDGSEHLIQIGAFVAPLSRGTHTITIRGVFDGDAIVAVVGGPFATEITHTINVE